MVGFDDFWQGLKAGLAGVPGDWERIRRDETAFFHGRRWKIDWVRFSSFHDSLIWGWLATPADHPATGAGMLWLPGYSYGTPPPDETDLVEGVATLCINVHGNEPNEPYVNPAGKNDYITQGIEDPATYIFTKISAHCLRALDVLGEQDGVDGARVCVGGMSQGGALALITAAQNKRARLCFADMPFLCEVRRALSLSRSPAYTALRHYLECHPVTAEAALATVSLFDPIHHAPDITVPTWMSAGGRDPASKPATIEAVFERVASPVKEYRLFEKSGHVFVPEMNAKQHEWIEKYLHSATN